MTTLSETSVIDQETRSTEVADAKPESLASTWATSLVCLACVGIYLALATGNKVDSWARLSQFGYLPGDSIWRGHYWALITSACVHMELWHVAFNVYWLWVLGSRLERAIGSMPYVTFWITSAFVSSACQLAVSDTTGIGASGVAYAIFGFMWLTRGRFPMFNEVLDSRTIWIFVVWLFACLIATIFKIWAVGNAAHFSGLLFGCSVAAAFVLRPWRLFAISILGILSGFSVVILFWCPWSTTWLGTKAYDAHIAGRYQEAIEQYTQIIQLSPQNAWAFLNRSYAYQALGDDEKADMDVATARKIDPAIEQKR